MYSASKRIALFALTLVATVIGCSNNKPSEPRAISFVPAGKLVHTVRREIKWGGGPTMHVTVEIELNHDRVMESALAASVDSLEGIAYDTYYRRDKVVADRIRGHLESICQSNAVKMVSIIDIDPCVHDLRRPVGERDSTENKIDEP